MIGNASDLFMFLNAVLSPYVLELIISFYILLMVDWKQTLDISEHSDKWWERNPILGRHPSKLRVNTWFTFCFVVDTLILWHWPEQRTKIAVPLLFELWCVINNLRLGIKP
jgi:hypothetical protein